MAADIAFLEVLSESVKAATVVRGQHVDVPQPSGEDPAYMAGCFNVETFFA
jgi:hypothetical protein